MQSQHPGQRVRLCNGIHHTITLGQGWGRTAHTELWTHTQVK